MKKNNLLFTFIAFSASASLLAGCGQTAVTKVQMTFGSLYDTSLSGTDHFLALSAHSDLEAKVTDKENFVLVVLPKDLGCTCWANFCSTINRYQKNKNLLIYSIESTQFDDSSVSKFNLNINAHLATIAIFENGAAKYQQTADGTSDSFAKDYTVFADWMSARLSLSNMLYVSKTQMEGLYKGTTPFTLGFVRGSCGDCSYVAHNFLKTYNAIEHNVSYLIDCDVEGIRYYNGSKPSNKETATADQKAAYQQWQTFKDDYGLSKLYDKDFGFDTGYVPMWVHCNPAANTETKPWGAIDDADVYVNDTLTKKDETTYEITNTYFDSTREAVLPFLSDKDALAKGGCTTTIIKGITVGPLQVDVDPDDPTTAYWKHEYAAKVHDPLLKSFFEKYIAMK